jgi:hypothetical protein
MGRVRHGGAKTDLASSIEEDKAERQLTASGISSSGSGSKTSLCVHLAFFERLGYKATVSKVGC